VFPTIPSPRKPLKKGWRSFPCVDTVGVGFVERFSLRRKMPLVRRNCRPLLPHIRTNCLASLGLFALYPGIDSRDCFRVSGSCMRGWEAAMPTDSLFLLSQAVAVALMILLSGTAAAAGCLSAPNQAPAGRRTLVLSNEPRNERQVLVSSRTRCSDSGREAYAAAVKPILHSAR
jgi:hypothetical protein